MPNALSRFDNEAFRIWSGGRQLIRLKNRKSARANGLEQVLAIAQLELPAIKLQAPSPISRFPPWVDLSK